MRGKVVEDLKLGIALESQDFRSAGTLYNGQAAASNTYIDAGGYDNIVFNANVGVIGTGNTMDLSILENDSDSVDAASAISGAAFTQLTPSNDQQLHCGAVRTATRKRYLWVQSVKVGTGSCNLGVDYAMAGGVLPEVNTPIFDVDGAP